MRKTEDPEKLVRFANCIAILTREIVSTARLHLGIDKALKEHEKHIIN